MITFQCPACGEWKTEKDRSPWPEDTCKPCIEAVGEDWDEIDWEGLDEIDLP